MQEKLLICQSVELGEPALGKGPKGFDAIHVIFATGKFVLAVKDAVVVVAIEDKAIIGLPSICKDG